MRLSLIIRWMGALLLTVEIQFESGDAAVRAAAQACVCSTVDLDGTFPCTTLDRED